jgi:hypothetical protein
MDVPFADGARRGEPWPDEEVRELLARAGTGPVGASGAV